MSIASLSITINLCHTVFSAKTEKVHIFKKDFVFISKFHRYMTHVFVYPCIFSLSVMLNENNILRTCSLFRSLNQRLYRICMSVPQHML